MLAVARGDASARRSGRLKSAAARLNWRGASHPISSIRHFPALRSPEKQQPDQRNPIELLQSD
ncbi:hypothetical protein PSAC2689_50257 [Paraburkholderia sacchari]